MVGVRPQSTSILQSYFYYAGSKAVAVRAKVRVKPPFDPFGYSGGPIILQACGMKSRDPVDPRVRYSPSGMPS
jgi:hypothetical protein